MRPKVVQIERAAAAITDWTFLCADRLRDGETIQAVAFVLSGPDMTVTLGTDERADTKDADSVTFWLLGGARGAECRGECRLTTNHAPDRRHVVEFLVRSH